ncbi:DISARM system phospholipase D-like protein DrmC [Streptomyces sp. UNOC14_S4]|uniref:DISARM system phospholipase D-like protein DrmC n=1 Tax=Streptomyces sp. UNOC14_S4 TaxID=2872340 RepID=UPI001E2E6693|nr:DISARM system phospholipase D-like protein DrmC [Streptomyces sp. UNOC14_S4]MCC3766070.1 DISARM system phospholipase D-like protein DrmC [Streptomyces sp. UNOC14_S4]
MSDAQAALRLGRLLTRSEAKGVADRLADGDTLTAALKAVAPGQREEARRLLEAIADGPGATIQHIALLRAVEGARTLPTTLTPLWTMPGHLAQSGPLTTSVPYLVDNARHAVTCSTFNFQRTSSLWTALQRAARRAEVSVRVYLDTRAADDSAAFRVPNTTEVAAHLRPAAVWRTKTFDGTYVRNHAKFLAIDHHLLLVTSANFSWSAENNNVEFGVLIDNPALTETVEREMSETEGTLYEQVMAR